MPCSEGLCQSPVDIRNTDLRDLADIEINYATNELYILNNGFTIQVDCRSDDHIRIEGCRFDLLQFHFHAPSEHRFNGTAYPLEMHLVHKDPHKGTLAVLGIMIEAGVHNPAFSDIFAKLPPLPDTEFHYPDIRYQPADLLPPERSYYHYPGSLTTPPFSEGVQWYIFKKPVSMSAAQIGAYTAIYNNSNRPLQDLNGRNILEMPDV